MIDLANDKHKCSQKQVAKKGWIPRLGIQPFS